MLFRSQGEATCPLTHPLEPINLSNNWPCLLCGDLRKGTCWTCKHRWSDGGGTCEYQVCDACFRSNTVISHGFIFSSISRFADVHGEPPHWKAEGIPPKRNKLSKHLPSQVRIFENLIINRYLIVFKENVTVVEKDTTPPTSELTNGNTVLLLRNWISKKVFIPQLKEPRL